MGPIEPGERDSQAVKTCFTVSLLLLFQNSSTITAYTHIKNARKAFSLSSERPLLCGQFVLCAILGFSTFFVICKNIKVEVLIPALIVILIMILILIPISILILLIIRIMMAVQCGIT